MTALTDIVKQYFDAWNAHDGNAVLATFNPGGSYIGFVYFYLADVKRHR